MDLVREKGRKKFLPLAGGVIREKAEAQLSRTPAGLSNRISCIILSCNVVQCN